MRWTAYWVLAPEIMASPQVIFVQFTLQPSGSPISGLMVVDALREAGFQVHAVYHQPGEMLRQYQDKCLTARQLDHGRWLAGGPWHRRLRRLLHDYRAAKKFEQVFRETQPNLVYINNLTGLSAALAARRLRIPCIWHVRELFDDVGGEMHPPWPGGKRLVRYVLQRCAKRIVVISRAVQENVLGMHTDDQTVVIPNAADECFFREARCVEETRRLLGLPQGRPIVGVPGTLRPVKGHEFFLEAFARVVKGKPDVVAAFAGDGEPQFRQSLVHRVTQLGVEKHVVFLGTVADMPAFYRACDLICIPSRSESFGRTAIEAMAVGTPVVATDVGGLRETIHHGETGLLVPYGDVNPLASAMLKLLTNDSLAARLASEARGKAEKEYGCEAYMDRIRRLVVNGRCLA